MEKHLLLLRADQFTKFAAGCIDHTIAAHFTALAKYYRTWAHEVEEKELHAATHSQSFSTTVH
jgi:hypothetical protein